MSILYHDGNRQLQDRFDSRRMADRLEEKLTRTAFTADDKAFIEGAAYFFLATADTRRPARLLVQGRHARLRARDRRFASLPFPTMTATACSRASATSRSMPMSACCSSPCTASRSGCASTAARRVSDDDPLLGETVGAQLIVRVTARAIFPNCPRYIPDMEMTGPSIYTPQPQCDPVGADLEKIRRLQGCRSSAPADLQRLGARPANTWWICATTAAPSPIAAPTRLVEVARTSPMAKTPGMLVSSGSGGAAGVAGGKAVAGDDEALLVDGDAIRQPLRVGIGADEQEQVAQRISCWVLPLSRSRKVTALSPPARSPSSATTSVPTCSSTFGSALMRSIR